MAKPATIGRCGCHAHALRSLDDLVQRFRASDIPKTAHIFGSDALERDQEKGSPVFRPIPLYTFEIDHVHQLEFIQLKLIVI
jgi:hypothetical protein